MDLDQMGVRARSLDFAAESTVFSQGDAADTVMYIRSGAVRLAVAANGVKGAVVGLFEARQFFGEACLAGQLFRHGTATTMVPSTIQSIGAGEMKRHLLHNPRFLEQFLLHMLKRNIRLEDDLADQLLNSSEKRLARTLLRLARNGEAGESPRAIPKLSQELLAGIVGTTRPRVNVFMNRFRKLGFVEYTSNGGVTVNDSLAQVVDDDGAPGCS